jgi:hypothetical protein
LCSAVTVAILIFWAHTDLSTILRKKLWQLVQEIAALNGTLDLMLLLILYSFFLMNQIINLFTPQWCLTTSVLFLLSNVNNASNFCNRDIIFLSFSFFGFSIPWTSHSPDITQTQEQQLVIRNEYNQRTFCIATHLGCYWISKWPLA